MAPVPSSPLTSRPSLRRLEGIVAALGSRGMQVLPRGSPWMNRSIRMTSTTMISMVMSKKLSLLCPER